MSVFKSRLKFMVLLSATPILAVSDKDFTSLFCSLTYVKVYITLANTARTPFF